MVDDALFSDPNWNIPDNFNLSVIDYDAAVDLFGVSTNKTDLTHMKNNGTKLMVYHGLGDSLISSEHTYLYYDSVKRDMNTNLDPFFRFYPISSMDHCYTGEGPWYVGGPVQYSVDGALSINPKDSVLMKMVEWVEGGSAPNSLLGYTLVNGTVHGSRYHCRYPYQTVYKGKGHDPKSLSSWTCDDHMV
ncbi:Tannase [Arthrobotrys entomopaga]|nr:Tannase [Arthrobotrys entomopaga]